MCSSDFQTISSTNFRRSCLNLFHSWKRERERDRHGPNRLNGSDLWKLIQLDPVLGSQYEFHMCTAYYAAAHHAVGECSLENGSSVSRCAHSTRDLFEGERYSGRYSHCAHMPFRCSDDTDSETDSLPLDTVRAHSLIIHNQSNCWAQNSKF